MLHRASSETISFPPRKLLEPDATKSRVRVIPPILHSLTLCISIEAVSRQDNCPSWYTEDPVNAMASIRHSKSPTTASLTPAIDIPATPEQVIFPRYHDEPSRANAKSWHRIPECISLIPKTSISARPWQATDPFRQEEPSSPNFKSRHRISECSSLTLKILISESCRQVTSPFRQEEPASTKCRSRH